MASAFSSEGIYNRWKSKSWVLTKMKNEEQFSIFKNFKQCYKE